MKKNIFFLLTPLLLISCFDKNKKENEKAANAVLKAEIMDADRAFSKLSEQKGLKVAFIEYIDSNGVLLRPNTVPLVEGNAVDFISRSNDTAFKMTWEPKSASIAASGELGYSYGIYSLKQNDEDSIRYGTYITIWKKQPNGRWKFVLHSGNEGVE